MCLLNRVNTNRLKSGHVFFKNPVCTKKQFIFKNMSINYIELMITVTVMSFIYFSDKTRSGMLDEL